MTKLMIVAGGKWQVPLVKRAHDLGYEVINVNPFEDSPGFKYADETVLLDVLDQEGVLEAAREFAIDGIVTDQSDIAVPTVAYVAETLGLPGIGLETAELFTNKFKMREFAAQHGFPVPRYTLAHSVDELKDFVQGPTIVKPLNSQSSRGISKITTPAEAKEAFNLASSYSHGTSSVIAEAFIQGTEFTVDGIFVDGVHHTLAMSKKEHFDFNPTIAKALWFNPLIPELTKQHDAMMNQTGVEVALTHTEYILSEGRYYLVEMAARGGGTLISSHIVPAVSGLDNYAILLASATGREVALGDYVSKTPYAVLYFFDHRDYAKEEKTPGARQRALESLRGQKDILDIDFEWDFHNAPKKPQDDRSRIGHVILRGTSEKDLHSKLQNVEKTLQAALIQP